MKRLVLAAALALPVQPVRAATVTVSIEGVRSDAGHVLVAICPRETFLMPHCPYKGQAKSRPGTVTVSVGDIPPGTYAAQAYQDETDAGHISRTLLGLPKDGIGFSNNARMIFGPPRFADAAFSLGAAGGTIHFQLHYY